MSLAVDLVQDGVHLEGVVALNIHEAVGPCSAVIVGRVATVVALNPAGAQSRGRSNYSRQADYVGVDIRGIVVVYIAGDRRAGRAGNGGIGSVLVRPRRVAAGRMDNPADRVCADEIP